MHRPKRRFQTRGSRIITVLVLVGLLSSALGSVPVLAKPPHQWVEVIIQASNKNEAADAARGHGGEVTHELGIINAVGARMPEPALNGLRRAPGIRAIFPNQALSVTELSTWTVRDEFNMAAYTNNDGTATWTDAWIEDDVSGPGPASGNVLIVDGQLRLDDAPDTWTTPSVTREVDLSDEVESATLSFGFSTGPGVDIWQDAVAVEISADGGTGYSMLEWINNLGGGQSGVKTYDISAYASAQTRVRFRVVTRYGGADEYFAIDNVEISYTSSATAGGGSDPEIEAARDEFNAVSYSGDDGTGRWKTDWIERGDDGTAAWGNITVEVHNCPDPSSQCIEFDGDAGLNATIERGIDLGDTLSAMLSFDYRLDNGGATYVLEVSTDGGRTWQGPLLQTPPYAEVGSANIDLTPYLAEGTRIRCRLAHPLWGAHLYLDNVQIEYAPIPNTTFASWAGADQLHAQGIKGDGVTIAVVDTGYLPIPALAKDTRGQSRVQVQYNAITDQIESTSTQTDGHGHGTHVSSLALSSRHARQGGFNGVAPDADLVSIKAFGNDGSGTYLDVIRAIDWAVNNKDQYNIRVLNLSFSAPPQSYYWDDPLNQAVMEAWQAGIVVVVAAGNSGPGAMTVGVPGNVPYVITVGAVSDNGTPGDMTDDFLTEFSSAGPTVEGFVKPDAVAPGAHLVGLMPHDSQLAQNHPEMYEGLDYYYSLSGTSQATAVTSGIVALVLQANPSLSPDDVKCKLLSGAHAAVDANGYPAYSVFQQGVGLVNAYDAVYNSEAGCANQGLNVSFDLDGTQHYGGYANLDPNTGEYYVMTPDGYVWSEGYVWSGNYVWSGGYVWSGNYVWSGGYVWSGNYVWSEGYVWSEAYVWSGNYVWSEAYVWSEGGWIPQE